MVMVKQEDSTEESTCHIFQINVSNNMEEDSCVENKISSSKAFQKTGSDSDCPANCAPKPENWSILQNDVIDDVINAEILHNLRTKLTGFPVDSYACGHCGEMFLSTSGCAQHLNRKSVHIIHICSDCDKSLEFFNRCEFLLHIKNHGKIPTNEYLKKTTEFKVISESKYLNFEYGESDENYQYYTESVEQELSTPRLTFLPTKVSVKDENFNVSSSNGHTEESGRPSIVDCSPTPVPPMSNPKVANIDTLDNQLSIEPSCDQRSDYWCHSCENDYSNSTDYFHHLEENEKIGATSKSLYICNVDNIPSYSQCKLVLHNRIIHKKCGPFICPECGQCFDSWEKIIDHAMNDCCHLSRSVLYSCVMHNCGQNVGAKKFYSKSSDLLKHFVEEHRRYVLQCIYCTRAFETYRGLFKHLLNDKHDAALSESAINNLVNVLEEKLAEESEDIEILINNYSKKLIQCLICNVIFLTDSFFSQHFTTSFNDHSEIKLSFNCKFCSEQFENKAKFQKHLTESTACGSKVKGDGVSLTSNKSGDIEETLSKKVSDSNGKACKNSSRTYRPRPKPLRIQPARAAATTTISNMPNPNYVSSTLINNKDGSSLRSHITQQCHYCRKTFDLNIIKKHESSCSKLQLDPGYCLACKKNYQGNLLLWYHGKSHLKNGLKVCLFCNNRAIKFNNGHMVKDVANDYDILENHLYGYHVCNVKLPYKCPLCKDSLADKEQVYIHLKKHHHLDTMDNFQVKRSRSFHISQQPRVSKEKDKTLGKSHLSSPIKRDNSLITNCINDREDNNATKKIKSEGTGSKAPEWSTLFEHTSNNDIVNLMEIDPPEQHLQIDKHMVLSNDTKPIPFVPLVIKTQNARQDGNFNCFKCSDFSATAENDFCDHIKSAHVLSDQEEIRHYNGGVGVFPVEFRDFWCPECDISFVVKPSLVKHLQFSHTYIENVEDYMKKVGYDSKRPLKEHQCEICYLRCSDSIDLYNHMKSHGMAFLRLRQQRKVSGSEEHIVN